MKYSNFILIYNNLYSIFFISMSLFFLTKILSVEELFLELDKLTQEKIFLIAMRVLLDTITVGDTLETLAPKLENVLIRFQKVWSKEQFECIYAYYFIPSIFESMLEVLSKLTTDHGITQDKIDTIKRLCKEFHDFRK